MTTSEIVEFDALIEKALNYVMSTEELEEQAIHWVIGNASEGPRPTESQVRDSIMGLAE